MGASKLSGPCEFIVLGLLAIILFDTKMPFADGDNLCGPRASPLRAGIISPHG